MCYSLYVILPCVLIFLRLYFLGAVFGFITKLRGGTEIFHISPAPTDAQPPPLSTSLPGMDTIYKG